jgi:hypothetical protein
MKFESANPSVVKFKQQVLLNAWLRAQRGPGDAIERS